MSINISSYSWNKSFLCSIILPTGVQMACFMWWPLFTIQPQWRPMRCHKCSPHRKTALWAETFVPGGEEYQERPHPESTRGASVPDTHLPFRAGRVLSILREAHWEAGSAQLTTRVCVTSGCRQGKQYTKTPQIGC